MNDKHIDRIKEIEFQLNEWRQKFINNVPHDYLDVATGVLEVSRNVSDLCQLMRHFMESR